jgi:hypothetical protein
MTRRRGGEVVPWLLVVAAMAPAQDPAQGSGRERWITHGAAIETIEGDYRQLLFGGGFRFQWPALDVTIHGQRGALLADRDETERALHEARSEGDLPRRGIPDPDPRRTMTPEVLRARLEAFLQAAGRPGPLPGTEALRLGLELPRLLYFEGGVTVLRQGVLMARCERLWISPLDDRMVLEDVELRYVGQDGRGREHVFTARGPRLVKQGPRWTGRDLTLTSCTAGEPHVALAAGEAEIVEREGQFEVWSRGNRLQFSGTSVLPLPDAHFFTGEQSEFPIKGLATGVSSSEGARVGVEIGSQYNRIGGAVHELLTGRPGHEFRGEWLLGVNWVEERGLPLEASLSYRAPGLYEGQLEGFFLDDQGRNLREVIARSDGSPITDRERSLLRTRNRVFLGERTHLDLSLFRSGDPGVYPEFFGGDWRSSELPETSAYLHHAAGNRLVTVSGRFNLDESSFADNRSFAPAFVEELPVATFHWIAQPIGSTPWDTPIVLDFATELGQRRSDFDDRSATRVRDRTFRADQLLELSAPFHLGPATVRPYASARGTWYDHDAAGDSAGRLALEAGVRAGTRLQRTFRWLDAEGGEQAVRHVIAPTVSFASRYRVDGEPGDFRQFDDLDALDEQSRVRLELRNLLQHMEGEPKARRVRDAVFLDLAQNLFPNADRDNAGERLGLFEYELLVRPRAPWVPLSELAFGVEGEHDWRAGMRTFNAEVRFGKVLGCDWTAEYRTDQAVDGAVGMGASTEMFGRWGLFGGAQFDLQTDDFLHYAVGMVRRDHDWEIAVWASFDPFLDEVTFRAEFAPRLFGALRPRGPGWSGAERFYRGAAATAF